MTRKYKKNPEKARAVVRRIAKEMLLQTEGPKKKRRKRNTRGKSTKPIIAADATAENMALRNYVELGAMKFISVDAQQQFAKDIAERLKKAIVDNGWVQPYEDKEYVRVEGWTMLGSLIGVTPVEDYCREIRLQDKDPMYDTPTVRGFEAKINLLCRGQIVGGASAQCTIEEAEWAGRNSFALRSMTITRATSKALRLNYGWIMSRAGFETMPADELVNVQKKIVMDKQSTTGNGNTPKAGTVEWTPKAFGVWPPEHNGNKFFIFALGDQLLDKGTPGIEAHMQQEFKAVFSDKYHHRGGWLISHEHAEAVKKYLRDKTIAAQIPQYGQAAVK